MEGIILAGGFGTRLRKRVGDIPKPIAPIAGRPFLCWLLDRLAQVGFRRIVLALGYGRAPIIEALGPHYSGIELAYAVEDQPLGTGGAIRHALAHLDRGLPAVWVMNGDTISALRHREMFKTHMTTAAQITMALARVADAARYGAVEVRDDQVVGFAATGMSGAGLINSGTYLLSPRLVVDCEWPEAFSFEHDFLPAVIDHIDIRAFEIQGWFIDIGVPEDFDRAQTEVPTKFRRLIR